MRKKHQGKLYFQTNEFLEKRKQTCQKRYGVDNPLQHPVFEQKRRQTNLQRFGSEHLSNIPHIRQKQKQGLIDSFGVEFPHQSPIIREKFNQTLLNRYNVPSLAYLSRCASKESQTLFWRIHKNLPNNISKKSHFADLNV